MKDSIKDSIKYITKTIKKNKNNKKFIIIISFLIICIVCYIIYIIYLMYNKSNESFVTTSYTPTTRIDTYIYTGQGEIWIPGPEITEATFTVVGGNGAQGVNQFSITTQYVGSDFYEHSAEGGLGALITIKLPVKKNQKYVMYVGNNGYGYFEKGNDIYKYVLPFLGKSSINDPLNKLGSGGYSDTYDTGQRKFVLDETKEFYGFSVGGSVSAIYLNDEKPIIVAGGGGGAAYTHGNGEDSSNVKVLSTATSSMITNGVDAVKASIDFYGAGGGGVPGGEKPPGKSEYYSSSFREIYDKLPNPKPSYYSYCLGGRAGTSLVPNESYTKGFAPREGSPYISVTTSPYILLFPNNPEDLFPNYVVSNYTYTNVVVYIPNIIVHTGDLIYLPVYYRPGPPNSTNPQKPSYGGESPINTFGLVFCNINKFGGTINQTNSYCDIIEGPNFSTTKYSSSSRVIAEFKRDTTIPIPSDNYAIEILCYVKLTIKSDLTNNNLQDLNIMLYVTYVKDSNEKYYTLRDDTICPDDRSNPSNTNLPCVSAASCFRDGIDNIVYDNLIFPPLAIPQTYIDVINAQFKLIDYQQKSIKEIIPNSYTIPKPSLTTKPTTTQPTTTQPTTTKPTTTQPTTTQPIFYVSEDTKSVTYNLYKFI